MFTLVQLRCFIAVAEELHFGNAAARLRMTQPPLSRQIQQLEREIGVELFDRTRRNVSLTEAGRTLLPNARRLIDLSAKTIADVQSASVGEAGSLIIAYTAMAGQSAVPQLVQRAARELPGVSLMLREMVTTDQIEALRKGTADVGLLRPLHHEQIRSQTMLEEPFVVAVPAAAKAAHEQGPISLRDLHGEALLMYSPGAARYLHDLVLAMFVSAGIHPRITQYADQVSTLLALVSAGLGFALVPAGALRAGYPSVVFRPIADSDPSHEVNRVKLEIAWSEDSQNPLVFRVLAVARQLLEETHAAVD